MAGGDSFSASSAWLGAGPFTTPIIIDPGGAAPGRRSRRQDARAARRRPLLLLPPPTRCCGATRFWMARFWMKRSARAGGTAAAAAAFALLLLPAGAALGRRRPRPRRITVSLHPNQAAALPKISPLPLERSATAPPFRRLSAAVRPRVAPQRDHRLDSLAAAKRRHEGGRVPPVAGKAARRLSPLPRAARKPPPAHQGLVHPPFIASSCASYSTSPEGVQGGREASCAAHVCRAARASSRSPGSSGRMSPRNSEHSGSWHRW